MKLRLTDNTYMDTDGSCELCMTLAAGSLMGDTTT
nr:MAG TPA: hypothetical protein [Caudoviricetes sp.]